jgi:uncharacterized membrane protein
MSELSSRPRHVHPVRRAIFRGLAVILPPRLTIVVFLWGANMIDTYILTPSERIARRMIVWSIQDVRTGIPRGATVTRGDVNGPATSYEYQGVDYVRVGNSNKWIPERVRATVADNPGDSLSATPSASGYYNRYVEVEYLSRRKTLPLFLIVFVGLLYLTGKLMAAGAGRFVWRVGEGVVQRMPIVRNVYSAVKQITDYVFSEQEVEFRRVVAVEYPRKGLWSLAFVTGDSFKDIRNAAGEPVMSVLIPTSPVPATGFTCTVLQRDTVALDITVDQALQFLVSCGVVVPPSQQWTGKPPREAGEELSRQIRDQMAASA